MKVKGWTGVGGEGGGGGIIVYLSYTVFFLCFLSCFSFNERSCLPFA